MTDSQSSVENDRPVQPGDVVYGEDGDRLGVVDGFTDDGFEVTRHGEGTDDGEAADPVDHERPPGQEYGEGTLVWRCDACGEMGKLDGGLPDECPHCSAPKTALYRVDED